ncbi:MAG: ferredoxin [Oscillospiraceae bacterium]
MRAAINQAGCIGCGLCAETCPTVFMMNDESLATVICEEIPHDTLGCALEAMDGCPSSVITVE